MTRSLSNAQVGSSETVVFRLIPDFRTVDASRGKNKKVRRIVNDPLTLQDPVTKTHTRQSDRRGSVKHSQVFQFH